MLRTRVTAVFFTPLNHVHRIFVDIWSSVLHTGAACINTIQRNEETMTERNILFRRVLGSFATGVAIVTTRNNNEYFGLTINSFTSVSLEPMLIQINIAKHTTSHEYIMEAGSFVVNILAEDQQLLSTIFSGAPPAERFKHVKTWEAESGGPVIDGSLAYIDVTLVKTFEGGDHTIFLGEVTDMRNLRDDVPPLVYYRGQYARLESGSEHYSDGSA